MKPPHDPTLVDANVHFFDSIAETYESWAGGLHGRVAARLVDLVAPAPGNAVLDVGCGTGLATHLLARRVGRGGRVIGLDVSALMLSRARAAARANTSFVLQSADHELPFRDSSFDLVLFCDSLEYLEDPIVSLREAGRVLRPGGQIALALRIRDFDTEAQRLFLQVLEDLNQNHPMVIPRPLGDRARLGEVPVISRLLAWAGFGVARTTTMVTGERAHSAGRWLDLMAQTSPVAFGLVTTLGPVIRSRLEERISEQMSRLGEEAFHHHEAFTFAIATKASAEPGADPPL